MKTYRIDKHTLYADDQDSMVDRAAEDANGNWVPADVAQGLYDALEELEVLSSSICNGNDEDEGVVRLAIMDARRALTAADGDGGDDD